MPSQGKPSHAMALQIECRIEDIVYRVLSVSYRIAAPSVRSISYRIVSPLRGYASYRIVSFRRSCTYIVSYRAVSVCIASYRIVSYRIETYRWGLGSLRRNPGTQKARNNDLC